MVCDKNAKLCMWAQAAEKAKSTDVDKVREAMAGQTFAAPSGYTLTMACFPVWQVVDLQGADPHPNPLPEGEGTKSKSA